jgi:hypothetical protein
MSIGKKQKQKHNVINDLKISICLFYHVTELNMEHTHRGKQMIRIEKIPDSALR